MFFSVSENGDKQEKYNRMKSEYDQEVWQVQGDQFDHIFKLDTFVQMCMFPWNWRNWVWKTEKENGIG